MGNKSAHEVNEAAENERKRAQARQIGQLRHDILACGQSEQSLRRLLAMTQTQYPDKDIIWIYKKVLENAKR